MIRKVEDKDFEVLQRLYLYLHEKEVVSRSDMNNIVWEEILKDSNYHILVEEVDGEIVASVTVIVIKNLTRNMRPYALIENVVTHEAHRRKGYAKRLIHQALEIAKAKSCYKVMLLTSSKEKGTLNLYRECGFDGDEKTGFIVRFRENDNHTTYTAMEGLTIK